MIELQDALCRIFDMVKPCPAVKLPLLDALGLVLDGDVLAPESMPAFSNSSMDGYALRSSDIKQTPSVLKVIEEIPAGSWPGKKIIPGTCSKIMTGAPLPEGSDCVVPLEASRDGKDGSISLEVKPVRGQYIRQKGEEMRSGDLILTRGTVLKPEDLALLASLGVSKVTVIPKPTISLITTGSEIIDHSLKPVPGQIRNSNRIALSSCIMSLGYSLTAFAHIKDDPDLLEEKLSQFNTDVILSCGAVSVGKYDFVKPVLAKIGKIHFWGVAIKPGKPFLFGSVGKSLFFGLPGNPVSSLVTFEVLVKPALARLSGMKVKENHLKKAILSSGIEHDPGRLEYVRAHVRRNTHGLLAHPLKWQGSHMLRSLTESNAWVVVPKESQGLPAGSVVNVMLRRDIVFLP